LIEDGADCSAWFAMAFGFVLLAIDFAREGGSRERLVRAGVCRSTTARKGKARSVSAIQGE
jgi:hypothetical protein